MTAQTTRIINPDARRGVHEINCRYDLHRTLRGVLPPETDTESARMLYRVLPVPCGSPAPLLVQAPSDALAAARWPRHLVRFTDPLHLQDHYTPGTHLRFDVHMYPVRRTSEGEKPLPHALWSGYLARQIGKAGAAMLEATCEPVSDVRAKNGITLTVARCTGTLVVAETNLFADALRLGIGRGRAWGLGLLTVHSPDQ